MRSPSSHRMPLSCASRTHGKEGYARQRQPPVGDGVLGGEQRESSCARHPAPAHVPAPHAAHATDRRGTATPAAPRSRIHTGAARTHTSMRAHQPVLPHRPPAALRPTKGDQGSWPHHTRVTVSAHARLCAHACTTHVAYGGVQVALRVATGAHHGETRSRRGPGSPAATRCADARGRAVRCPHHGSSAHTHNTTAHPGRRHTRAGAAVQADGIAHPAKGIPSRARGATQLRDASGPAPHVRHAAPPRTQLAEHSTGRPQPLPTASLQAPATESSSALHTLCGIRALLKPTQPACSVPATLAPTKQSRTLLAAARCPSTPLAPSGRRLPLPAAAARPPLRSPRIACVRGVRFAVSRGRVRPRIFCPPPHLLAPP